jgi:hypothetical protein
LIKFLIFWNHYRDMKNFLSAFDRKF